MSKIADLEPVKAGRFSHKLVVYEEPELVARLQEVADANGASVAAIVRLATRKLLERIDRYEARIG